MWTFTSSLKWLWLRPWSATWAQWSPLHGELLQCGFRYFFLGIQITLSFQLPYLLSKSWSASALMVLSKTLTSAKLSFSVSSWQTILWPRNPPAPVTRHLIPPKDMMMSKEMLQGLLFLLKQKRKRDRGEECSRKFLRRRGRFQLASFG